MILVGTFYQLLLQTFFFARKNYPPVDNIVISVYIGMLFLPNIAYKTNHYYNFLPPFLRNNGKRKPRRNIFKQYSKQFYRRKIKIRNFSQKNKKLLKHTDESTRPMTTRHPEMNNELLSHLQCYLAPKQHWKKIMFDTDSFEVCADSGASSSSTQDKNDFIPGTYKTLDGVTINGIASGLNVEGYGSVSWVFKDDKNENIELIIEKVLHIPGLPIRLICPQQVAKQTGHIGDGLHAEMDSAQLIFGGFKFTTQYNKSSGLPIYTSASGISKLNAYNMELHQDGGKTDNLTLAQRSLLKWHRRLGHMNFRSIIRFARLGLLPSILTTIREEDIPKCTACCFGKQSCTSHKTAGSGSGIADEHDQPGMCVSIDQIESPQGGLIPVLKGKQTKRKYHVATIFVDHFSKLTYIHYSESTTANEAVEAKHAFEHHAATFGVSIQKYHADNGAFNTRVFKESIIAANQSIAFSGVDAHHQNGIAERMIKTITYRARSMLLNAMICWPDVITTELWPYATKLAVDIGNNCPDDSGLTSLEKFSSTKGHARVKQFHTFGSPCFILDPKLCQKKSIPKWTPRSRQAVYLGTSPQHAGSVALVLNLKTGYISPQFHIVFDDDFTTTSARITNKLPDNWNELFKNNLELPSEEFQFKIGKQWNEPTDRSEGDRKEIRLPPSEQTEGATSRQTETHSSLQRERVENNTHHDIPSNPSMAREGDDDNNYYYVPIQTRSGRKIVKPTRFGQATAIALGLLTCQCSAFLQTSRPGSMETIKHELANVSIFKATMNHMDLISRNIDNNSINLADPRLLAADISEKDNLHLGEAMKADDREDFLKAMEKEVHDLNKEDVWEILPMSSLPSSAHIIRLIWSFKRKRNPFGELTKHKARLCVHGGMQREGVDFHNTFAPVVNWSTVRLIIMMAEMAGWESRQIDYVLAFSQAPIDSDVYLHLPAGFHVNGKDENEKYVLKLKKNLYGTIQAAANWFDMLKSGLEDEGFKQNKIDPCLFVRSNCIVICYVDDCCIFSKDKETIDILLKSLSKTFKLTDEGDVNSYLGMNVSKDPNGTITMSQPAIIDKILNTLKICEDSKMHDTPANIILTRDENGNKRKQEWHYRSVIGQMNYLAGTTRPDILFAVHQCAKYSIDPKQSHEEAVKRIGRYLKKTRDKGLVFTPDGSNKLECYADADFAGAWCKEDADEVGSVLSRTGYLIKFANCPIVWVSKMQTEVALSTTEAEYISLSQSMRDLIPLRRIMLDVASVFGMECNSCNSYTTTFEDNKGAIELAKGPKYRPRTKHLSIKWHHFREHIKRGTSKIVYVDTNEQHADIMTKPLPKPQFEYLRKQIMGW